MCPLFQCVPFFLNVSPFQRMATRLDLLLPSLARHLPLFELSSSKSLASIQYFRTWHEAKLLSLEKCHFTENLAKLYLSIISAPLHMWSRTRESCRFAKAQKAPKKEVFSAGLPKSKEMPCKRRGFVRVWCISPLWCDWSIKGERWRGRPPVLNSAPGKKWSGKKSSLAPGLWHFETQNIGSKKVDEHLHLLSIRTKYGQMILVDAATSLEWVGLTILTIADVHNSDLASLKRSKLDKGDLSAEFVVSRLSPCWFHSFTGLPGLKLLGQLQQITYTFHIVCALQESWCWFIGCSGLTSWSWNQKVLAWCQRW